MLIRVEQGEIEQALIKQVAKKYKMEIDPEKAVIEISCNHGGSPVKYFARVYPLGKTEKDKEE